MAEEAVNVDAEESWKELREAAAAYRRAFSQLRAADAEVVVPLLRDRLTSADNGARLLALRFLEETGRSRQDVLVPLFPDLVRKLVGPQAINFAAKAVLLNIEEGTLYRLTELWVDDFVADSDNDWGSYWGLLSLLDAPHLERLRQRVLASAADSIDSEVRNAAADWQKTWGSVRDEA